MIPKRKRRVLVIDDTTYEYCIIGHVSVFIHNQKTNERISWHQEWKPKWKQSIKPSDVRTIIETGELNGVKSETEKML